MDGQEIQCDGPECTAKIKNNAWAKIKAEGWFFTRDGKTYCPDHIPAWVDGWRKARIKS